MNKQNNMTAITKLYKVLKVKMQDLEKETQNTVDDNEKGKGKGKGKGKTITTNTINIITSDIEYLNKNKEKEIFQATTIKNKSIRQYHTLVKDNEIIRIIRALNLNGNNELNDNYIFIKDIITIDVKVKTYKEDTKDTIILSYQQLDKDKNIKVDDKGNSMIKNVVFKRLMANSGSIRNKKVTFIRENLWSKANEILLGGLPADMKYPHISKFNAYYALPSTDSTPVTQPNIVVIDDYEKDITETFNVVKPIKDNDGKKIANEYTCKAEENHIEKINPFDGAGIVDISLAKIWAIELGLYKEETIEDEQGNKTTKKNGYIPSYFQFRAIPGIKGNVYVMDIKKYAIDYRIRTGNKALIHDVFGNDIEVINKDGNLLKNVILTKSQFKFANKWKELYGSDGFNEWQKNFDATINGYKRTFNIAKYSVNFKDIKREVLLSYQPLQTLHFNDVQISSICQPTIDRIKAISTDANEFLKYRGIMQEFDEQQEGNNNILIPPYYKALEKNRDLWNDEFIQDKVQGDIKGFKERSYKGCIIANGNYQVAMPDIVGLIQYAFGEKVVGCLKANQIYSRYWLSNKINKVDIIRFPHIAMEHRVSTVVKPEFEIGKNWLEYIYEGIVTSMYDSNALAANSMDFDGDKIMTISTKEIIEQAEKEIDNTIVLMEDSNAGDNTNKSKELPKIKSKELPKINDINKIIETDVNGMSNNIGSVVNQISKLWSIIPENKEEEEKIQEYIRIMSIIGSLTIDFVKTGIKVPIPPSIEKFLKDKEIKKPDFMKWKYKKIAKDERAINRNKRLLNKKEVELFGQTLCTVNKISWYMQKQVKDIELENDTHKSFDYSKFIINNDFNKRAEGYIITLKTMKELKKEEDKIGYLQNKDSDDFVNSNDNTEQYLIFYEYAKNKLREIVANKNYKLDKEKMLDYLLYIVANEKEFNKYDNMNLIWNTWGNELNRRLNDKKLITKRLDAEKIAKKVDKIKKKVDKKESTKEKVYIDIFKDANREIKIYDMELQKIKTIKGINNKKVALTMLVLDKFCKEYKKDFNIANNKQSIKMYNIYHLAGINHKNIEGCLKRLNKDKVLQFDEKNNGKVLNCIVNINDSGKEIITIKDVNEIKNLFKLIS